ncbi:MAG: DUF1616 domain-containing protein [Promethearchaeota archaeon]
MNEISKNDEIKKLIVSNKQFGVILTICLIIGIIVISGFIVYYIFKPEPGYITFGILNEEQKAEKYPTEASINESVSFYLTVGNYLDRDFRFLFMIKKGNSSTILTSTTGSNGSLYLTLGNFTLNPDEYNIYGEYNISFSEVGENQIIIAELWQISKSNEIKFYNILWLRLNITV